MKPPSPRQRRDRPDPETTECGARQRIGERLILRLPLPLAGHLRLSGFSSACIPLRYQALASLSKAHGAAYGFQNLFRGVLRCNPDAGERICCGAVHRSTKSGTARLTKPISRGIGGRRRSSGRTNWRRPRKAGLQHLASEVHAMQHSGAIDLGENLATWPAGHASLTRLGVEFGATRRNSLSTRHFREVSSTGDWKTVAHYSQLVWRKTTEVGCGLATGAGQDYLVCQYNPMGNFRGEKAF